MARRKAARKQRTLRTETYGKGSIYQDKRGPGGTRPQPKTESDSPEFEPLVSKKPEWLKRII
jgi:hypothetical protein